MRGELLILLLITLLFSSCTQKSFDSKEELISYLKNPENGLFETKVVNDIEFQILYQPTDLLVQRELDTIQNKNLISTLRKKYSENIYFNLSISKRGNELLNSVPKNREEFSSMVSQLSFSLDKSIHLYNNKHDTIHTVGYVYPRMFGTSKATSLLFVFPKDEKFFDSKYLNFTIEDMGFRTGEVRFKINTNKIKGEPKLTF